MNEWSLLILNDLGIIELRYNLNNAARIKMKINTKKGKNYQKVKLKTDEF
jgi:hypothetical protein